jgi:DNA replication and repair protein RecF
VDPIEAADPAGFGSPESGPAQAAESIAEPAPVPVESAPRAAQPLVLEALALSGFRNLQPTTFVPGSRFNVLFGDNGAGKSSVLEAIGYLAALRSFRDAKKEDIIALDAPQAQLHARVQSVPLAREYRIVLERHKGRSVQVDQKRPTTLGSYFASFPLVLFHPGDVELMLGPPEPRRRFLDRVLEQIDPGFARSAADYDKALRSRNRLLKSVRPERRSVSAYDPMLAELGARIGQARQGLSQQLKPRVEAHFAEITEHALALEVSYAARHAPDQASLLRELENHYDKDVQRGYTGVGPHGDDLRVGVARTLVKHHASQGQHRAIVLALKVAELSVLAQRTGKVPLLLLDDVSSELDQSRNRRFFKLLSRLGSQVFLTTTHREFILLDEERCDFRLEQGAIRRCEAP